MPDIADMILSNPEMAQSLTPEEPDLGIVGNHNDFLAAGLGSSFQQMRGSRRGQMLSAPGVTDSQAVHHAAVADTSAYDHAMQSELGLYHAANIYHDTAAFHQAVHAIKPSDPQYEDKMLDLAQRFPFAQPNPQLMEPLHEARRTYLAAHSAIEQRKDEATTFNEIGKNNLTVNDLANPAYRNPDGSVNHQALHLLAAARESGQLPGGQPKLTPEEEIEWKAAHVDPNYKKILQATDNPSDKNYDPAMATRKALFWSANRKLQPAAQPTAATLPDANKIFGGQ